jgi:hypothetical protein
MSGALIAALLVPALASCSSHDSLQPADVQKFIVTKEVTDNLSRLIAFLSAAEQGMEELAKQRPGSADARTLLSGAQVGWQNVLAEVTNFSPAQAKVVPGLADAVVSTREAAIEWENALNAATPAISKGTVRSFADLSPKFARARAAESKARASLAAAVTTLAKMACDQETAHPDLAPAGAAAGDCATASRLAAASPPS